MSALKGKKVLTSAFHNDNKITVEELIAILSELDQKSSVINGDEENIRVFPGRENKKRGKPVVMIL